MINRRMLQRWWSQQLLDGDNETFEEEEYYGRKEVIEKGQLKVLVEANPQFEN